jgi:hypothetical protein
MTADWLYSADGEPAPEPPTRAELDALGEHLDGMSRVDLMWILGSLSVTAPAELVEAASLRLGMIAEAEANAATKERKR